MMRFIPVLVLVLNTVALSAEKDAPFPHIPPTPAAEAIRTFELHPGLKMELVASEPLIESPVGISFDEDGKLYVVEMRDYPDRREQAMGRIKLLQDSKGDGHFDRASVFADHIPWPTSVFCYDRGVYVTASPDIIWFKDTHGTGEADQRQVIYSGFGVTTDPLNVQGLVNNLTWNLDDRIEGTPSFNGGQVALWNSTEKPIDLHGRDFSFSPADMQLRTENGGGQHGMTFDAYGRKFVCMNNKAVETFMYNSRYASRNPYYSMPASLAQIDSDGPDVFRISPEEAWRVLRTQLRVAGQVKGPIENGGRSGGYYTGVSGITIYTGDALPAEFSGNAFVGEVANNVVVRQIISADGVGVVAHRSPEEKNREFLASKDIWFRPVQFANGPDGALYVIDMYRECIEHPWSLPDDLKARLDLHSGVERGRIWRIVPDGFTPRKPPKLSKATTKELVALLAHPNGWHRDTAARLLFQKQDPAAIPALEQLASGESAMGRFRALGALDGQGALRISHVLAALRDRDANIRKRGIVLAERFVKLPDCPVELRNQLNALAADPDITVRYQLALSLGESRDAARAKPLTTLAEHDSANAWMLAAIISSSQGIEANLFANLQKGATAPATEKFLAELAQLIGRRHDTGEVRNVISVIQKRADSSDARQTFELARSLRDGLRRAKKTEAELADLAPVTARAKKAAGDNSCDAPVRVAAIRLLGTTGYADSGSALLELLASDDQSIQLAAVEALDEQASPEIAPELIRRIGPFPPAVRAAAIAALLRRPERARVLLQAIADQKMKPGDLTTAQANSLRKSRDVSIRDVAEKLLSAPRPRDQVIAQFQPTLSLVGDANHGHAIYQQRCAQCHRLGGEGFAVGPDLTTIRNDGKPKALVNILDPNREVAPNFVAYAVQTNSGDMLLGILAAETATSITLRQPFGKDSVVLRSDIKRIESQKMSLMPEGLEEGLKPQDLADLLEFVFTVR